MIGLAEGGNWDAAHHANNDNNRHRPNGERPAALVSPTQLVILQNRTTSSQLKISDTFRNLAGECSWGAPTAQRTPQKIKWTSDCRLDRR